MEGETTSVNQYSDPRRAGRRMAPGQVALLVIVGGVCEWFTYKLYSDFGRLDDLFGVSWMDTAVVGACMLVMIGIPITIFVLLWRWFGGVGSVMPR